MVTSTLDVQATVRVRRAPLALADRVRELGLTTGRSRQSKLRSPAWVRPDSRPASIGQFSTLYSGIEDMVVAWRPSSPAASRRIRERPATGRRPQHRRVVIGDEGALCFMAEVTVKLLPLLPGGRRLLGWTLKDMKIGFAALRADHGQRLQAVEVARV